MKTKVNISRGDIEFVENLMSANSDAVGFIPTKGIKSIATKKGLIILYRQNKRVGYLLSGPIKANEDVSIYQVCIDRDARRTDGGKELFLEFKTRVISSNAKGIRLRCASNLEANEFWHALGFKLISTDKPTNRRKRAINTYFLSLQRKYSRTQ